MYIFIYTYIFIYIYMLDESSQMKWTGLCCKDLVSRGMSENPLWDYFFAWLYISHRRCRDVLGCFTTYHLDLNTRASPSCTNSSRSGFMTLCFQERERVRPTALEMEEGGGGGGGGGEACFSPGDSERLHQAATGSTHTVLLLLEPVTSGSPVARGNGLTALRGSVPGWVVRPTPTATCSTNVETYLHTKASRLELNELWLRLTHTARRRRRRRRPDGSGCSLCSNQRW